MKKLILLIEFKKPSNKINTAPKTNNNSEFKITLFCPKFLNILIKINLKFTRKLKKIIANIIFKIPLYLFPNRNFNKNGDIKYIKQHTNDVTPI